MGTLTAVPVPPPARLEPPVPAVAMLLAPVAGLVPGLAACVVLVAGRLLGLGPLLGATLAVAAAALLTRGMHLDGLADTADGLAASYDRQRALDVMRRGDVGPAGVTALVLVLLVQVLAIGAADAARGPVTALVALVAGRLAVPVCCLRGVPAARATGLGAQVAGSVPGLGLVAAGAGTALAAALLLAGAGHEWWPALLAVAAACGVAAVVVRRAGARLGGITGDVIGAAVELGTAAAAVALAVAPFSR